MNRQDFARLAVPCPGPNDNPDYCKVCRGLGERCPVFVATHPDSPVAMSASPAVKRLAIEWQEENQ